MNNLFPRPDVFIAENNVFTGANVFRSSGGITTLQAATQDAIKLLGRAGGTGSYVATLTPLTLSASRTWSLPDRDDTFAGLAAQTFTGAQTIDVGSGTLPSWIGGSCIQAAGADNTTNGFEFVGWKTTPATSGVTIRSRVAGGTRASPAATPDNISLLSINVGGHDGTNYITQQALYQVWTDGLWSGTNRGTYYRWQGTPNGSTSSADWMYLRNGLLGINASPTTGNGLLQLSSGTTKANGVAWGTDTFLYRTGANALKTDGSFTAAGAITALSTINVASLTEATAATAGDLIRGSGQDAPYMLSNGIGGWMQKCICSGYAVVTQTGAVTAQSLITATLRGTKTIPANFFKQGKVLKYRLCGRYTTDAAPGTYSIDVKLGSTVFRTTGAGIALDNSVTNGGWILEGEITCLTTGATGTVEGVTFFQHELTGATANFDADPMTGTGAVTIDTTASQAFDVLWTASDAGTSITCTCFRLWEVC